MVPDLSSPHWVKMNGFDGLRQEADARRPPKAPAEHPTIMSRLMRKSRSLFRLDIFKSI